MKKQNLALRLAAAHVAAGVALLASVTPSAASEPTSTDAWGQAIRRGAKQEGIKTDEQKEEDEAEEAKLMAERLKLRWSVHAGFGVFATSLASPKGTPKELTVGAGVRKGISRLWDFHARASLSLVLASTSTFVIPSADGAFRVHFGEASPWFFGTGVRLGGVVGGNDAVPLVQALLEIGVVVVDHIEIVARPTIGAAGGIAAGFTLAGGYVF